MNALPCIGVIPDEHTVPAGYHAVELKQCENCVGTFIRAMKSGRKYCKRCCAAMLLPVDDLEYRAMLPDLPGLSQVRLPNYDRELVEKYLRQLDWHSRDSLRILAYGIRANATFTGAHEAGKGHWTRKVSAVQ